MPGRLQRRRDPGVHRLQPPDRGEQAEPAAAGRQEQRPIGAGQRRRARSRHRSPRRPGSARRSRTGSPPRRAAPARAGASRRPAPRPPPRRSPASPSPVSRSVAEVTSRPCAGAPGWRRTARSGRASGGAARRRGRAPPRRSRRREWTCCGRSPGSGGGSASGPQHRLPGGQRRSARRWSERHAASMRCRCAAVELVGLVLERVASRCAASAAARRCGAAPGQRLGRLRQLRADREAGRIRAPPHVRLAASPRRQHLRAGSAAANASVGLAAGSSGAGAASEPARPARRRQGAGRLQRRLQRRLQLRVAGHQVVQPAPQAARARPAALGAQQPAAQLRAPRPRTARPRTRCRPRRTRGGPRRTRSASAPRRRRARPRPPAPSPAHGWPPPDRPSARAADRVLDEAALLMRAGAVDALAAPVGERRQQPRCRTARRTSRAGRRPGCRRPPSPAPSARSARAAMAMPGSPPERRADRVLQVQQAQVVLAPLAHHHAAAALGRVGKQPAPARASIWRCRWRVKVLIQTAPWLRSAHRLAGAM